MSPMKDVKWIVIHCSYTKASQKVTVDDLDNFHQAKIVGHRDFPRVAKTCPLFDAQKEYATLNANLKIVN